MGVALREGGEQNIDDIKIEMRKFKQKWGGGYVMRGREEELTKTEAA